MQVGLTYNLLLFTDGSIPSTSFLNFAFVISGFFLKLGILIFFFSLLPSQPLLTPTQQH